MKVLGIDPGTVITGIGIIERANGSIQPVHFDTICAPKKLPLAERLRYLYQSLTQVIRHHRPTVVALEDIFFHHNFSSAVKLGEARAMVLLAATCADLKVAEYPPARVKQAVSGNGRATKAQIQYMVRQELALRETPPPDAADALAVALCHMFTTKRLVLAA